MSSLSLQTGDGARSGALYPEAYKQGHFVDTILKMTEEVRKHNEKKIRNWKPLKNLKINAIPGAGIYLFTFAEYGT